MTRAVQIYDFITKSGWGKAKRSHLAGDASNRRYERLLHADGRSAVLMDAPSAQGEDTRPFIKIAQHLNAIGLSAPEILAADTDTGLLLIEDLGDRLFAREMLRDKELQEPLYQLSIDVLVKVQDAPPPDLKRYTSYDLTGMISPLVEYYQPGAGLPLTPKNAEALSAAMLSALAPLDSIEPVMWMRDYHAENLLFLPDRAGTARAGLLDFQDAVLGHPAYDLVSILQDARRDVPKDIETRMIDRFLTATSYDTDPFRQAYAVLGVQRNLRIMGIFTRLCQTRGDQHYIDYMPRLWDYIQDNLKHPGLSELKQIIDQNVTTPTPAILSRLKTTCPTNQTP